jgi:hypothetical protein
MPHAIDIDFTKAMPTVLAILHERAHSISNDEHLNDAFRTCFRLGDTVEVPIDVRLLLRAEAAKM